MNRRTFFAAIFALPAVAVAAPLIPANPVQVATHVTALGAVTISGQWASTSKLSLAC